MSIQYTEDLTNGKTYYGTTFSGYALLSAFDDNPSSMWYSAGAGGNPSVDYITVDFGINRKIAKLTLFPTVYSCNNFILQYSDDNINFINHHSNSVNGTGTKQEFIFNPPSSGHRYWKLYISSTNGGGSSGMLEIEMMEAILPYFMIKQNNNYYTVKTTSYDTTTTHNFTALTLSGGTTPNSSDIETFGFDDLNVLTNSITVGSDTFIPINKFDNTAELKLYKPI